MSGFTIDNPVTAPLTTLTNVYGLVANVAVTYRVSFVTHFGETLATNASIALNIPNFPAQPQQVFSKSIGLSALRNYVRVSNIVVATNPNVIQRRVYRINGNTVSLVRTLDNDDVMDIFDATPIGSNISALPTANTANSVQVFNGDLVFNNLKVNNVDDSKDISFYGAVGDGVTDNTDILQAAIDANANKSLYIPTGVI